MISFNVLLNSSITTVFPLLKVEYISILCLSRTFLNVALYFFPSSTHNFLGILSLIIFSIAFVTDAADLSFIGTAHAYLLNTSITVRIYLNPLLKEEKACLSTKSADHISSLLKTITDRLGNYLLIDLCNSSANFSFQPFFFTQTELVFGANYWFNY